MNYIIIDNFFEDPNSIRKKALTEYKYYDKKNHPIGIGHFPGFRTLYLDQIDNVFYRNIFDKFVPIFCKLKNIKDPAEKYSKFLFQASFSYTLKGANSCRHIDDISDGYKERYGALVYLRENPPKKSGTTLYLDNKKKLLENKYNRLVMYSSDIEHEPTDNFGSDINNGRLVLTMFLDVV